MHPPQALHPLGLHNAHLTYENIHRQPRPLAGQQQSQDGTRVLPPPAAQPWTPAAWSARSGHSPAATLLHSPGLPVLAHQADERVDLGRRDVLLQELAVVVQQGRDGVLGQHVVADLLLHEAELLGDVLLPGGEGRSAKARPLAARQQHTPEEDAQEAGKNGAPSSASHHWRSQPAPPASHMDSHRWPKYTVCTSKGQNLFPSSELITDSRGLNRAPGFVPECSWGADQHDPTQLCSGGDVLEGGREAQANQEGLGQPLALSHTCARLCSLLSGSGPHIPGVGQEATLGFPAREHLLRDPGAPDSACDLYINS